MYLLQLKFKIMNKIYINIFKKYIVPKKRPDKVLDYIEDVQSAIV